MPRQLCRVGPTIALLQQVGQVGVQPAAPVGQQAPVGGVQEELMPELPPDDPEADSSALARIPASTSVCRPASSQCSPHSSSSRHSSNVMPITDAVSTAFR